MGNKVLSKIFKGDKWVWLCFGLLLGSSLMFVYSSTAMLSYKQYHGNTFHFLITQGLFIIGGVLVALITSNISYKKLFNLANAALGFGILLLLLTWMFGDATNDAKRWLKIPIIDQTLQTSDIAKICLTIFIAKVMSTHQNNDEEIKKGALISALAMGVVFILILPANLSTALLIVLTSVLMLIIARVKIKHILLVGSGAGLIALLLVISLGKTGTLKRAETWVNRIEAYVFTGEEDAKTSQNNFQADQAKIAVARGGLFGQGISGSTQKYILPHPYSDFMFATIIEEKGLIAGIFLIIVYMALMHRTVLTAKFQSRSFPAFLCIGLGLNITLQAIANMVVSVNIVPVTGQPLPLISMGGTSLIITSFSIGIILNISRYSDKEGKEKEKEEVEEQDREQNIEDISDYPFVIG